METLGFQSGWWRFCFYFITDPQVEPEIGSSCFLPAVTEGFVANTALSVTIPCFFKCLNSPLLASVADFDESKSPSVEQLDALREFAGIAAGASAPDSLATLAFLYLCLAISAKYG